MKHDNEGCYLAFMLLTLGVVAAFWRGVIWVAWHFEVLVRISKARMHACRVAELGTPVGRLRLFQPNQARAK